VQLFFWETTSAGITALYSVRNPEKLRRVVLSRSVKVKAGESQTSPPQSIRDLDGMRKEGR
jgi:hypothetical protein